MNIRRAGIVIACFLSQFSPLPAIQQEQAAKTSERQEVTSEYVESLLKQAASHDDPDEKKKIEADCKTALDGLKKIEDLNRKADQYKADAVNVAIRVSDLRDQLSRLEQTEPSIDRGLAIAELETAISQREGELVKLKAALADAEAEPAKRVTRRQSIRNFLLGYSETLESLKSELDAEPSPNEKPLVSATKRAVLEVSRLQVLAEVPAVQNELNKYDAEDATDYVRLTRDVASRVTKIAEQQLEAMKTLLSLKRSADLKLKVMDAETAAADAPSAIQSLANENVTFAQAASDLAAPIAKVTRRLEEVTKQLETIQKEFKQVERRVNEIGLTGSIGAMLRRQRNGLPDLAELQNDIQSRKVLVEDVQYKAYEYDDLRTKTFEEEKQRYFDQIATVDRNEEMEKLVVSLVEKRREYLDDVIRSYKSYIETLFDLDATEQLLLLESRRYANYIDERVLWIRSNKPLYASFSIDNSDYRVLNAKEWRGIIDGLANDLRKAPFYYLMASILLGYLFWRKPLFRRELEKCSEAAERANCTSFRPTGLAILFTFMLVITWPGVISFLAWRLNVISDGADFSRALASALFTTVWATFPLELFRRICQNPGLASSHFGWPDTICKILRVNIRLFMPFALFVAFYTSLLHHISSDHGTDVLERLTFIGGMVVLIFFLSRILHRESGIVSWHIANNGQGMLGRLKGLWYWLGLLIPLLMIGLAATGFYYTAQRLSWEFYSTFLFLVALQLSRASLERWLTVRRRLISIEQMRERRSENATPEVDTTGLPAEVEDMIPVEETEPDVSANTEQTRRLIQTAFVVTAIVGFWLIWVDVLPALKMLDRWTLWTTTAPATPVTTEPTPSPTGAMPTTSISVPEPKTVQNDKLVPVTIADLGLAILIGIVTIACARNIPGLLEISILSRLPVDNSIRYAVTTVSSYLIVLIGLILAFNAISIGWSKVQWLATALTFGLAFGLQEIFANFVAGLILLFERPMRVGDIVTIDDITGVVSRIRIRATTITNWDRKEYVVPNKEFITGRMLNWTLSDKVNRVTLTVGVAYGSDIDKAKELLRRTCEQHPQILDDPSPLITFEGFGDNSLTLVVRTFLPDLENRLAVIDDLHTHINSAFKDAGIEIAFPQRDLHLRSVDPAVIKDIKDKT